MGLRGKGLRSHSSTSPPPPLDAADFISAASTGSSHCSPFYNQISGGLVCTPCLHSLSVFLKPPIKLWYCCPSPNTAFVRVAHVPQTVNSRARLPASLGCGAYLTGGWRGGLFFFPWILVFLTDWSSSDSSASFVSLQSHSRVPPRPLAGPLFSIRTPAGP